MRQRLEHSGSGSDSDSDVIVSGSPLANKKGNKKQEGKLTNQYEDDFDATLDLEDEIVEAEKCKVAKSDFSAISRNSTELDNVNNNKTKAGVSEEDWDSDNTDDLENFDNFDLDDVVSSTPGKIGETNDIKAKVKQQVNVVIFQLVYISYCRQF